MKGNNARTPEQQEKLQRDLFPILEGLVRLIFPEGKISLAELKESGGAVLKIHVDEIGSDELVALAGLVKQKQAIVCLRRSGTGITIMVTFGKEVGESSKSK